MGHSVAGKTAIVTGAGSGINLEFARLLLQRGANVLFADLSLRPEAQELIQEYSSGRSQGRGVFHKTNVSDWTQIDAMFEAATSHFGRIDIVCPGAGVYEPPWSNFWIPPGSTQSKDRADGDRYAILDVNLTHPIRTTQLAIAHFLKDAGAASSSMKFIIHISSVAGQRPSFATPIYVATKHALNGFVRSLAPLEDEHHIRVACVAPGVIKTPLWTSDKAKAVDAADEWVLPEEVAEAMLALIEEDKISESKGETATIPIRGGTILEVSKERVREVRVYNDPGPNDVRGNTTSNAQALNQDALNNLKQQGWGLSK